VDFKPGEGLISKLLEKLFLKVGINLKGLFGREHRPRRLFQLASKSPGFCT
jgi:hypothetical protein